MPKLMNINYLKIGTGVPIFLLHGFAEDMSTWDEIIQLFQEDEALSEFALFCLDLPGHGQSEAPRPPDGYSLDNILKCLHDFIHALQCEGNCATGKYILLGYSYGGRLALHYAIKYKAELDALILESASFGLKNEFQKELRKQADEAFAEKIQAEGVSYFERTWSQMPIFNSQKNLSQESFNKVRKRRLANNPNVLSNTLRMTGQGVLPYILPEFLRLNLSTLYICGSLDEKYAALGQSQEIASQSSVVVEVVRGAGHNVHLEKCQKFYRIVREFLLACQLEGQLR